MWESEFPTQSFPCLEIDRNFLVLAGLMDDIALKVYDTFAYHVSQVNFNHRVKTVGLWSLQMTASAVLAALRNVVDPVSVQR